MADDVRLRVGLPAELARTGPGSGHTNVWRHVLRHLAAQVDLRVGATRRVDVWLGDGHRGPLPGEPQLLQVHDAGWSTPELAATMDPTFVALLERNIGAAVDRGAHLVVPSAAAAGQVVDRFGADPARVHPVHHGVDTTTFRPDLGGGPSLVRAAGGRLGVPYVLYVGVAHPRKNAWVLRDAVTALTRRGIDCDLVLVSGPPRDRPNGDGLLADLSAPLPGVPARVVLLQGSTDARLAAVVAGAAAVVLPSLMEGFGLPALEAMACGRPVVVSDRGALPEVVGAAGEVVEPTAGGVEVALARILTDDAWATELGRRALRRASELPWSATAAGWRRALEATVAEGRQRRTRPSLVGRLARL